VSWLDTLLLGTHGRLVMEMEDLDHDLTRVRNRQRGQEHTDETQFRALLILRHELTETRRVVAELTRLLLQSGALDRPALERFIEELQKPAKTIGASTKSAPDK
jgi:hypothetical protein